MGFTVRATFDLIGILQGVGFRPTVARLVGAAGLGGWVRNRAGTVRLVLEGDEGAIRRFIDDLPAGLPRQARLESVREVGVEEIPQGDASAPFEILPSEGSDEMRVSIPADLATCADCLGEIFNPRSRYHLYPFTTCTNCGPRYTVVDGMPYDRERTALKDFPLCDRCMVEYTDSTDRRFHAESIACPTCGPRLFLLGPDGRPLDADPLSEAREALAGGKIVAVRGLGGFLLAVNAHDRSALERLRERKHRPHKPLAVMARDLDIARKYCVIPDHMGRLMRSEISPIAVLDLMEGADQSIPMDLLAPGTGTLGVMLPTTPIHHLLAAPGADGSHPGFELLVMTSGNRGGEPICVSNEEALERLTGIADLLLCHDRGINLRNDDSLAVSMDGEPQVWRRARGYAPESLVVGGEFQRDVVAMGAEIKNTMALGFGNEVVLSPHIGDLETPEALDGLLQVLGRFPEFFGRKPAVVAVDLHPDMRSTVTGVEYAARTGAQLVSVQHHHAHAASCMAENGLAEAIALVFDGTGLGTDGSIWGAEILHVHEGGFRRLGTFAGAPLPGSDRAVTHPVRQLLARWIDAGVEWGEDWQRSLGVNEHEVSTWSKQCAAGMNAPRSHAAGRVFDAFSVALGIAPSRVTYEGQAAVLLESVARGWRGDESDLPEVPFDTREEDGMLIVDWAPAFERLARRPVRAQDRAGLARSFHEAMATAALRMAIRGREVSGFRQVALSGGVMMNRLLCETLCGYLRNHDFDVFLHRRVPPNDGGISLGQAVLAGGIV